MGSTISMVKRTYMIGRSNRNAPTLYRAYNCYDHLFPYELDKESENAGSIRLKAALESFNSLVSRRLKIPHQRCLQNEEVETYKNTINPEKVLYKMLTSSPEARDVNIEVSPDEKQIYLCRNYIIELNEEISELNNITVFQTCCNYLKYIPYGIGRLNNLKMLIISRNRLIELPDEIAMCKELREIDVSFNLIKKLPKSIAGLKKLNTLHLSANRFEELPSFLGKLNSLKYLNVSHNPLKSIPLEIFKLPFLLSLTADGCDFQILSSFDEVGSVTLKETIARRIIKNNLRVRRNMPLEMREYLMKVQECSFCGGPFFEHYIEVHDRHNFEGEIFPVNYRLCFKHYNGHAERLQTLFEKNLATYPARLLQENMPTVTELFEPFCFDELQRRTMEDGIGTSTELIPLISLAMYNTAAFRKFSMEMIFDENLENLNVFDDTP